MPVVSGGQWTVWLFQHALWEGRVFRSNQVEQPPI